MIRKLVEKRIKSLERQRLELIVELMTYRNQHTLQGPTGPCYDSSQSAARAGTMSHAVDRLQARINWWKELL